MKTVITVILLLLFLSGFAGVKTFKLNVEDRGGDIVCLQHGEFKNGEWCMTVLELAQMLSDKGCVPGEDGE